MNTNPHNEHKLRFKYKKHTPKFSRIFLPFLVNQTQKHKHGNTHKPENWPFLSTKHTPKKKTQTQTPTRIQFRREASRSVQSNNNHLQLFQISKLRLAQWLAQRLVSTSTAPRGSTTRGFKAWCTPSDFDRTDSFSSSEARLACKRHRILSLTLPSVVYGHILISHSMEYNIFLAMSSNLVLAVANQTLWWQIGPWQAMIMP